MTIYESDRERIAEILECEPANQATLGRIAALLRRSVRYCHKLVRGSSRFGMDDSAKNVGSYTVRLRRTL